MFGKLLSIIHYIYHLPEILHSFEEQIDGIESSLLPEYMAHVLLVPEGVSAEVAWHCFREGEEMPDGNGIRTVIITDLRGNYIKELI